MSRVRTPFGWTKIFLKSRRRKEFINKLLDATRVTGVGGFFFKAQNPGKSADRYRAHLGIALVAAGKGKNAPQYYPFHWREKDHPEKAAVFKSVSARG
jgi:hypothetical protein